MGDLTTCDLEALSLSSFYKLMVNHKMRTRSKSKKKKKEKNEGKSYRAKSVGSVRGRNKISSYQFENSLSNSKTSDNWITLKIFSLGKYVFSVVLVLCQHLYSFLYFLFICVVGRERHDLSAVQNGYELVIKAIKEVEFILDTNCDDFNTKKTGNHRNVNNPEEEYHGVRGIYAKLHSFRIDNKPMPRKIIKKVLYINTMRNKLVHNYDTTNLELGEIHSIKSVYAVCRSELLNFIKASEQKAKTIR